MIDPISPGARRMLESAVASHPHPLLFATVSGAHLYGFPSPDSDFDLRGAHILPIRAIAGLKEPSSTVTTTRIQDGLELDLVSHDIKKFFGLMLKRNGYVLEQLLSPLVIASTHGFEELCEIAQQCVTRHHSHHYLGFAENQWELFTKEPAPRLKPLLYVYRVLLTGIHLMRTGRVEANLPNLNQEFRLSWLDDLIAQKLSGAEKGAGAAIEVSFHEKEYARLRDELERAAAESSLAEAPTAHDRLDDLLIRLRLNER